jgi:hypothetical protein
VLSGGRLGGLTAPLWLNYHSPQLERFRFLKTLFRQDGIGRPPNYFEWRRAYFIIPAQLAGLSRSSQKILDFSA